MDKIIDIDVKIRKGFKILVEFCSVASTRGPKILIVVTKFPTSIIILTIKVLEDYKKFQIYSQV